MDESTLRELFNARFDALETRITQMFTHLEKENERRDVAIERLADRTAPLNEHNRLVKRVDKLEEVDDRHDQQIAANSHKIRILWWVGTVITSAVIATVVLFLQRWLGL